VLLRAQALALLLAIWSLCRRRRKQATIHATEPLLAAFGNAGAILVADVGLILLGLERKQTLIKAFEV
jgi:hypothetical protein